MSGDIARWDLRLRDAARWATASGLPATRCSSWRSTPPSSTTPRSNELTNGNATLGALFGATGSLTTPTGWMNANLYANFVPLFALFMTVGYGAAAIAGQDEEGTLGGLVSLPLTRTRLLTEKLAALVMLCLPIPVLTLVAAVVGRSFDLRLDSLALVGTTIGVALLALDFGLLALAVGVWTGRRGPALGVAVALAAAAYVVSALAPAVSWIHPIRFISPFFWSVGANQVGTGLGARSALALVLVALVLAALALARFRRMDVH